MSKNFFSILSADNLIGVNGFLTSWAIFLAMSDHAACFSARINDVVSSIATTNPFISSLCISFIILMFRFLRSLLILSSYWKFSNNLLDFLKSRNIDSHSGKTDKRAVY